MSALVTGKDCSSPSSLGPGRVCSIEDKKPSHQETLQQLIHDLWIQLHQSLNPEIQMDLQNSRMAVIFSSTKGIIEDHIWTAGETMIREQEDPFNALLAGFCEDQKSFNWTLRCNVSNACASSHVAIEYAQDLFKQKRIDHALIIAADLAGSFIYQGFQSLKLISSTTNRPFSKQRDGLQLGEAVAMTLFSNDNKSALKVLNAASNTEGTSITRPSVDGRSLARAMELLSVHGQVAPDFAIAHGTGTIFNDQAEDLALANFLGKLERSNIPITNTKWSLGHTLGASGMVDFIAACEVLKSQKLFAIHNTTELDKALKMNYCTPNFVQDTKIPLRQALVSSLGFGGVHAALVIAKGEDF